MNRRLSEQCDGKEFLQGNGTMKETTKEILSELIARYPALSEEQRSIAAAFELLLASAENGGKIMICGNGGSAADSAHIVGELMKSFKKPRPHCDVLCSKGNGEVFCITIADERDKKAYTRAYFTDEFNK